MDSGEMPQVECLRCEKEFYVTPYRYKRNLALFSARFFCSMKCYIEYRKEHGEYQGKRNPAWKGGVTRQPYICKKCGKTFFRPNVSSKLRHTVKFCSKKCRGEWYSKIQKGRRSHKRYDLLKDDVTIPDIKYVIYFAGFFDGEGSVMIVRMNLYDYPILSIGNTNKQVIDWTQEKFGGGSRTERKGSKKRKTFYVIRWEAFLEVEKILSAILPYLIVKKEKAENALNFSHQRISEIKRMSEELYGVIGTTDTKV